MRKKVLGVALGLLLCFMVMAPPLAWAADSTAKVIEKESKDLYEPAQQKESVTGEDLFGPSDAEHTIPYQDVPKIPQKKTQQKKENSSEKSKAVKGGNEKAINPLATKENKARGTVLENVNEKGKDITPKSQPEEPPVKKENPGEEKTLDMRQFLTFQTKSGKTMHLIVDHAQHQENVQLLTEVGEQDLLNMIEGESDYVAKKEEVKKVEPPKEEPKKEEVPQKSSGFGLYFFIGLLLAAVLGAGYYVKIYSKKQTPEEEDREEENEWDDEEWDDDEEEEISEEEEKDDSEDDTILIEGLEEEEETMERNS